MPAQQANGANIKSLLETRPVQFQIKAGGAKWACTVHSDRAAYDRVKATRTNSTTSLSSTASGASSPTSSK